MNYLYQFIVGLTSSALVVWLATVLALRRFYSEKWWEKRASALIEITDAVYQVKIFREYNDDLRDFRRCGPEDYPNFTELNETQYSEMSDASLKAKKAIEKFSQVGPLLITEKVSKLLKDYVKAEATADYDVHYRGWDTDEAEQHILELTRKLLVDLVAVSKKELKST